MKKRVANIILALGLIVIAYECRKHFIDEGKIRV